MSWQWPLLICSVLWMPAYLLGLTSTSSPSSWVAQRTLLTSLVPLALPLFLVGRMNKTIRYYWRFSIYCTTLGITSAWAVALSVALNLVGKSKNIQHYVARSFYNFAGPLIGWSIKLEGAEYLDTPESKVIIGNHQSMIDIFYLGRMFPKGCAVTAKRELKWIPFLGQFMWLSNSVFIDRRNRKDATGAFTRAVDFMHKTGMSIFVFAEGTRTNTPEPTMLPFKKGAFYMAVQGKFPIVPVVMENYHHLYAGKDKRFEAGELICRALPPVSTEGYTASSEDITKLSNQVRQSMLDALEEIASRRQNSQGKDID